MEGGDPYVTFFIQEIVMSHVTKLAMSHILLLRCYMLTG